MINSFFLNSVKETKIVKLIGNLSSNKGHGLYSIPVKVSKYHEDSFKLSLAYLIHLSFQQGVFPDALKTARVIPIFKG